MDYPCFNQSRLFRSGQWHVIRMHGNYCARFSDVGRFPFNQNVRFTFSATSRCEWQSILQNFHKRGQPREVYPNFQKFFPGVCFPFNFASGISGIFGWMVRISEIQQFPEFLKTFRGHFCTICRCFQIFESFGWMESAHHFAGKPLMASRKVGCFSG